MTQEEVDLWFNCETGDQAACDQLEQPGNDSDSAIQSAPLASSGEDQRLFDVYKASVLRPRDFDSYVQANRVLLDSRFFNCLRQAQARAPELARVSDRQCHTHIDPQARQTCFNYNPFRGMDRYLEDLDRTIRSNGALNWRETQSGSQALVQAAVVEMQLKSFDSSVYPGLVFALGQNVADQRRQIYAAQLYEPLERSLEPLRQHLYCR